MKLAIIGATGSCGRQVAAQLLERKILPPDGVLHLIGHAGGAHEMELWGVRADLHDAFADRAPRIEVGTNVAESDADIVVTEWGAAQLRGKSLEERVNAMIAIAHPNHREMLEREVRDSH